MQIEFQLVHHHLHLGFRQLIGVFVQGATAGRARLIKEILARLNDVANSALRNCSVQILGAKDVAEHVLKYRLWRDQQIFESEEVNRNVGRPSLLHPVIIEPQPRVNRSVEPFVPPGPECRL